MFTVDRVLENEVCINFDEDMSVRQNSTRVIVRTKKTVVVTKPDSVKLSERKSQTFFQLVKCHKVKM